MPDEERGGRGAGAGERDGDGPPLRGDGADVHELVSPGEDHGGGGDGEGVPVRSGKGGGGPAQARGEAAAEAGGEVGESGDCGMMEA